MNWYASEPSEKSDPPDANLFFFWFCFFGSLVYCTSTCPSHPSITYYCMNAVSRWGASGVFFVLHSIVLVYMRFWLLNHLGGLGSMFRASDGSEEGCVPSFLPGLLTCLLTCLLTSGMLRIYIYNSIYSFIIIIITIIAQLAPS